MLTKKYSWIAIGLLLAISFSGCIELRKISLYDGQVQDVALPKPEKISKVVAPILFEEDTVDMWGIVDDSCKSFSLTNETAYKGETSLKLSWERQGCKWVGFGMGWDGWSGKDLTPIMKYAAFEMYVKAQKGKMYGLPMVFTLEDYSGVMAFCYTANKYFERTAIDNEWQRVVVPLKAFNDEGEGIDYTNIKQLQVEMQQSGSVFVDDIKLVFYEEEPQKPWFVEATLPNPVKLPQVLFDDNFANKNGWGLFSDDCQQIEISNEEKYDGNSSLHVKWNNTEECHLVAFGSNWNKWKPIDISPIRNTATLKFFMKADAPKDLDFTIAFEEFDAPGKITLKWDAAYAKPAKEGWKRVEIPLKDFKGQMNETKTQHLAFRLMGRGDFYIDNITLEN
ncbi:MAG: hypothetical protein MRZ79_19375 [Bacteroidia bacterium]|nr:hypothetical protein [Bacteroidia bacterium]